MHGQCLPGRERGAGTTALTLVSSGRRPNVLRHSGRLRTAARVFSRFWKPEVSDQVVAGGFIREVRIFALVSLDLGVQFLGLWQHYLHLCFCLFCLFVF